MKVKIQTKEGNSIVDLNRRKAIRERCLNCTGWCPKEAVNCSFFDCPLYPFRDGKGKQNVKERNKAIHKYCLWCMGGKRSEVSKCTSIHCPLFIYRTGRMEGVGNLLFLPKKDHIQAISEPKMEIMSSCIGA